MKKIWRYSHRFLLVLIGLTLIISVNAQDADSANEQAVENTLNLIQKADSIKQADSLQRLFLEQQIQELKASEKSKRVELENRLKDIRSKDSLNKVSLKKQIDSLKSNSVGFPVSPFKDPIFSIHTNIGSISAKERAKLVQDRLVGFYKGFIPNTDSLEVANLGGNVDVLWGEQVLFSITELDAMWYGKEKVEIAESFIPNIYDDLKKFQDDRSLFTWIKNIGLTLGIILIQILLIRLVNYLFRKRVDPWVESKKGVYFTGFKIRDYEVLDQNRQVNFVLGSSRILRLFINLFQLYLTIPLIFIIFPPTEWIAKTLFGYVWSPVKSMLTSFLNYIPNLFTVIVIVVITRYLLRFIKYLSEEIRNENLKLQGFYPDWARPTFNIVRVLVYAFMFVVIFPYLPGSDSPVFQGVSVFLGLVFSLGSSSVIGNMVAGLVMTYMRPFQIGDRIKINDIVGNVIEKTPFVTRIKTPKHEYITVPNSNILSGSVVNYSTSKQHEGIILHTTVTIGYDVPWRKVHETLIAAALKTDGLKPEPTPFVLQTSLDDFYVSYQLNAYSDFPNKQPAIYSELHQNIQDLFNENGIEILSPHYRAARDGNMTTIPENYLPKDYEAPSFRVQNNKSME